MTINRRLTPPRANRRLGGLMRALPAARALGFGLTRARSAACARGFGLTRARSATCALGFGLVAACSGSGGAGGAPTPANCAGSIELLVENETPLRVRVLELSRAGDSRLLGEMSGRGTRTFTIRDFAGMTYAVVADETGELLASEQGHPRGYQSRGATISRACVERF